MQKGLAAFVGNEFVGAAGEVEDSFVLESALQEWDEGAAFEGCRRASVDIGGAGSDVAEEEACGVVFFNRFD